MVGYETVLGFATRADILAGAESDATPDPYDASGIIENGVVRFDMKVIAGDALTWLIKVESGDGSNFAEVNVNTSTEGADPVVGEWQTYTFPLSDFADIGLNPTAVDVILIFPAWGTGAGAVYRIDNLVVSPY